MAWFNESSVSEIKRLVEGQTFYLKPGMDLVLDHRFQHLSGYRELDKLSKKAFNRFYQLKDTAFKTEPVDIVKQALPVPLCQDLVRNFQATQCFEMTQEEINDVLGLLLTESLDSEICSYFQSEYTLLWYSLFETKNDQHERAYSSYWHCDGGPAKHLKALVYLNEFDQHQGNTHFLGIELTQKLKQLGYIFNDINKRVEDVSPLLQEDSESINIIQFDPINAGDLLLFNPNKIAHRGVLPSQGSRYVLQLCFIQSPFHWQQSVKLLPPTAKCIDFCAQTTEPLLREICKPRIPDQFVISKEHGLKTTEHMQLFLDNVVTNKNLQKTLYSYLIKLSPDLKLYSDITITVEIIRGYLNEQISQGSTAELLDALNDILIFEQEYEHSLTRYANPKWGNKIFWPMPDHPTHPNTKFGMMPFINKHPILDKSTPIGSAGSCFAFEIARVLQQENYNYVVTERNDNPASGFGVDGYRAGDKFAKFCANYGILFNTPSFRQLAERAFGIKQTKQLLFQQEDGGWVDPYRENVLFFTPEAYFDDYHKHLLAVKKALLSCEVFIVTLGLNECWQFRDGTVMSRNPRPSIYPYVRHKTLTVEENVENIQSFFDIVKSYNPNFKLIVSVSPVPFIATGRGDEHHVISANTHSKSILRVAAEKLVATNKDMYYLPSYELVMECIKDPWEIDTRHVKRDTVTQVITMFKEIFHK